MPVVLERDEHGYFVSCPSLQGCYSQGETYEDAIKNIEDSIRIHIEDRKFSEEKIADTRAISISNVEIFV